MTTADTGARGRFLRVVRAATRLALAAAPWLVSGSALGLGAWVFSAIAPVVYGDRAAAVLSVLVLVRLISALGAISAGSFAMTRGLVRRWFGRGSVAATRDRGLIALGAASMAAGTFVMVGPFVGVGMAHSLVVVGGTGLLAAAAAYSAWVLRTEPPSTEPPVPPALAERSPADEWFARDLGRMKTPA